MEFRFVILIVASVLAFASLISACTEDAWAEFKEKYDKTYENTEDDMSHYYTFCDNVKAINEHNNLYKIGESTYQLAVNKLTDLLPSEQSRYYGNRGKKRRNRKPKPEETEPESPEENTDADS